MDAITENNIRQEQIETFGRLMAGFSHDMKNHLGIIRESNGLMGDILDMGGLGEDEISVGRLKKSIASIERRVVIAANMFHHLSGLAHRPDTEYSSFQINDLIREECVFMERFSRLKQTDMVLELEEGLATVYNDPSLFQHVFYRVYSLCLEQLNSGDRLIIMSKQDGKNGILTFRLPAGSQVSLDNKDNSILLAAVTKIGGILEAGGGEATGHVDVNLTISSLTEENNF